MSEFKGTKGPWNRDCFGHVKESSGRDVLFRSLSISCAGPSVAEAERNTDLIAAAPDLLEVLQEVQEFAQGWSQYEMPIGLDDRINAAIAKALNTNTTER